MKIKMKIAACVMAMLAILIATIPLTISAVDANSMFGLIATLAGTVFATMAVLGCLLFKVL